MALTDNLIAYLQLEELSGVTAADDSGNGNTGTFNGTNFTDLGGATGQVGSAVAFDNTSGEFISISGITTVLADFSAQAWINVTALGANRNVLSRANGTGTGRLWLRIQSTGALRVNIGGVNVTTVSTISAGVLTHVAMTYNGTANKIRLFINGAFQVEGTVVEELATGNFNIGANQSATGFFNGVIDDVGIWDRTLSDVEVTEAFDLGNAGNSLLAGLLPFAPVLLTTASGDGEADLIWSVVATATSYTIKYGTTATGPYPNTVPLGDVQAHTVTGLDNGTTFYFVVTATNELGESPISNELNETPLALPAAPTLSTMIPQADTTNMLLTWSTSATADSYTVKLGTSTGVYTDTFVLGDVQAFTILTLAKNTQFFAVVSASNETGESGNSNERSATTIDVNRLSSLLSYLELEESTGTLASDSSGNNNDGTLLAGVTALDFDNDSVTGQVGNALNLSVTQGAHQQVRITTITEVLNQFTISAWVKPDDLLDNLVIISRVGGADGGRVWIKALSTTGVLKSSMNGEGIASITGISTGVFTHVVMIYDFRKITFFINGIDAGGGGTVAAEDAADGFLKWGVNQLDEGGFHGDIDDLAIWNRALLPLEVTEIFDLGNAGLPLTTVPPVAPTLSTMIPQADTTNMLLTWSASATADSYTVKLGTSTGVYTDTFVLGDVQAFTIPTLAKNTQFFAVVSASGVAGESGNSNERSATTIDVNRLSSLLSYLELEESTGTLASDSSGNNNDGTLLAGVTALDFDNDSVTGQVGNALNLSVTQGAHQQVRITTITEVLNQFTISAWVKPDDLSNNLAIISRVGGAGVGRVWLRALSTTGILRSSMNGEITVSTTGISAGVFTHVVMIYDFRKITFFINGIDAGGGGTVSNEDAADGFLKWAVTQTDSGGFHGDIDDLAIWNRALLPLEVTEIFDLGNAGLPLTTVPPVAPTLSTMTPQADTTNLLLTWSASATADSYTVKVGTSTGVYTDTFVLGDVQAFTIPTLAKNTQFFAVVSASSLAGESGNSDELSATTINVNRLSSLLSYLELEESTGTLASDSSGNNNDGTLLGTLALDFDNDSVTGQVGNALNLSVSTGTEQQVRITTITEVLNQFTISAWVKPDDLSADLPIISRVGGAGVGRVWFRAQATTGVLRSNMNGEITLSSTGISASVFTHVVMIYDFRKITFFINGVDVGGGTVAAEDAADGNLKWAVTQTDSGGFHGDIDDLAIWSRALLPSEITEIFDLGNAGNNLFFGLFTSPVSTFNEEQINDWASEDPSLDNIGTLTEPFDLGTVLANAHLGTQIITERQRVLLNRWSNEDPGLNRVATLEEQFMLGDLITELVGTPPFTTTLSPPLIKRINDWSFSDPSLNKVNSLTSPFMLGDVLNELLNRS